MMDNEGTSTVSEYIEEARGVSKRQLVQQAIGLAVQSRWQEAVDVNRRIVEVAPNDAEAHNRLGKAYTELGRIAEAREAYENAMQSEPANLIAQRNLERLSRINENEAAELAKRAGQKLDPRFFIEETGKTGVTVLQQPAEQAVLTTLTAGDQVKLDQQDGNLLVTTMDGAYVGRVDERLAARLTRLIGTGNQYQAGVIGADDRGVRIIIRETFQSPQNVGRVSFLPQGKEESFPRPYLREGLVRRAGDEEDEDEIDVEGDVDLDEDEDEDTSEFGFHETGLDEA